MGELFWYHARGNGDRNIVEEKFKATHVSFKFRSEHRVEGKDFYGEM